MATNRKYLNISIQPSKIPKTSKPLFELPKNNLSEAEIVAKSTSDRTKRRVAHVARYPRPVITRPIAPVKLVAQPNPKKRHLPRYNLYGVKLVAKSTLDRTKHCVNHVARDPQPVITKPIAPNLEKQNLPMNKLSEAELVAKSTSDGTKQSVIHVGRYPQSVITKPIAPVKVVAQPNLEKQNLPRNKLSEAELVAKSTSDGTKRSVDHVFKYPQPVITRPINPVKVIAQPNPEKQHVLRKCFASIIPCKVRQINETVALDSRAQHNKSTTSGVDKGVNVSKRKLGELECDKVKTIKKNKSSVKQTKIKDVEHGIEPRLLKGVKDSATVHKRKSVELECGKEIKTKKQKLC